MFCSEIFAVGLDYRCKSTASRKIVPDAMSEEVWNERTINQNHNKILIRLIPMLIHTTNEPYSVTIKHSVRFQYLCADYIQQEQIDKFGVEQNIVLFVIPLFQFVDHSQMKLDTRMCIQSIVLLLKINGYSIL